MKRPKYFFIDRAPDNNTKLIKPVPSRTFKDACRLAKFYPPTLEEGHQLLIVHKKGLYRNFKHLIEN